MCSKMAKIASYGFMAKWPHKTKWANVPEKSRLNLNWFFSKIIQFFVLVKGQEIPKEEMYLRYFLYLVHPVRTSYIAKKELVTDQFTWMSIEHLQINTRKIYLKNLMFFVCMSQQDELLVPECHLVGSKLFTQVGRTWSSPPWIISAKCSSCLLAKSIGLNPPSYYQCQSSFVILLDLSPQCFCEIHFPN